MTRLSFEARGTSRQPLGMSPARFLRDHWQKRPLLIRDAFPDFAPPLSPNDLAGLACMQGALARIVSHDPKRHHWALRTGPFDDDLFAKLPESHWTLLVQDVDKWDGDTAALLDRFAFIPSWRIDDVMASYATDSGGVGAHVDQYDVFLLQGFGQRRWAIDTRTNPSTEFRSDIELKLLHEFRPTHAWTLEPGDMLYLPPGVPHEGTAIGECMTFSIGMRAPAAAEMLTDFAHFIAESLPEEERYTDPDLQPVRESGEIDDAAMARAMRAMPWAGLGIDDKEQEHAGDIPGFAREVPASLLRKWFGCFITRYRIAQVPVPRKRPIGHAALAERLPHAMLDRDPWSRFAWCRNGRHATLFAAGTAFDAPLAWARTLASGARCFDGARLSRLPQPAAGIDLLTKLTNAGYVRFRRR